MDRVDASPTPPIRNVSDDAPAVKGRRAARTNGRPMPGFYHILVPLDGTPTSELALATARKAVASGGRLTLVQIAEDLVSDYHLPEGSDKEAFWTRQAQPVRDYLEQISAQIPREDLTVEVIVAAGHPAEAILDMAEELEVDAVSMVCHSRSKVRRMLLGSTVQKVMERLTVPLLLIHPKEKK
jgi:nucleotide-binding universal stress UspA family protein